MITKLQNKRTYIQHTMPIAGMTYKGMYTSKKRAKICRLG
jgi:hypothetical protein